MDATASGAQWDRRAGLPVSDRPARGRTTLQPIFDETRRMVRGPARPWAETVADGEVVWSWRPDAGVKSCGDASGPSGFEMYHQSARRRWRTSPVTREKPKQAVNHSRRESRSDPVEPVVHSCASCAHDRGCNRHPAFPAPSVLKEGEVDANLGRIAPREYERISSRCLKFESDVSARHCEER